MSFKQDFHLYIALVHYPVLNKHQKIIGSAVTNLDIHDIARASRTYGVAKYFLITPYEDQKQLITEITDHWKVGHGASHNPARKKAFEIVCPSDSIEEVIDEIIQDTGTAPLVITTSAMQSHSCMTYKKCSEIICEGKPVLLLFGTAHGLAPQVMEIADNTLPPIFGAGEYNHLSVRSAVSIILDRLLGLRE